MPKPNEIENVSMGILVHDSSTDQNTYIEIYDEDANIQLMKIQLTNDQLASLLSRRVHVKVEKCEVFGLKNAGKKCETKKLVFKIPDRLYGRENHEKLSELAYKNADEGWIPSTYFGSQNSFYIKDDQWYACTHQTRWVEKEVEKSNKN